MFVQYLIALIPLFTFVVGAPLFDTNAQSESPFPETTSTVSMNNETLSDMPIVEPFQDPINYETLGGVFEGDMVFPYGINPTEQLTARGVAIAGPHLWPNNVIPYDLSAISSASDRTFITNAMQILMYAVATSISGQTDRRSCVYFRPRVSTDQNFLRVVYGGGCSGTVGYWPNTNMQMTLASPGCFSYGVIQHELMHILGFHHEQTRPDRDSYITINLNNIQPGMEFNFNKYTWGRDVLNQNTPYDYTSVMHYSGNAFSRNGQPTIVSNRPGITLGQQEGLSATDIAEVRALYKC